ncbi:polysaccharide deacetylase [Solidesulfovibrio carbinoliphilus subsp. oakridgensis]|uniref:Polysaccharide deacetylase n=1 Tax=Solidesulfovibrio carbinoliphilus subsp. oakridgensis TaxID=694327 RepID=G7QCI2_9BACT|nr:polysaccharide deacetylase family protein [Solidesulfovibrio carbinoliphilus]EHJ46138.1 polysaccharide deacetylase [Solidesulfovibrio carbinoliphilus subsp. oakridgensis]
MKAMLKRILGKGCASLGFARLADRLGPGRFTVLMFHRIVDGPTLRASANAPLMLEEGLFRDMAETLASECRCLPLTEAMAWAGTDGASVRPVVALTFDDGYGDFRDKAFPILRRFGLPATMYLPTGFLDEEDRFFWWDAVEAFFSSRPEKGRFDAAGLPAAFADAVFALAVDPGPDKVEAFIRGPLRRLAPRDRARFVDRLAPPPVRRPAMLDWDAVRELAATGLVEFGAHGVTHPLLDEVDLEPALQEVATSKRRIEEETGRTVTSFAYPSGCVPPYHRQMLARAGIGLAVTTRFGGNGAATDPLLLRRVDARLCLAGETFDPSYFLAVCSGCLDWLHGTKEA